MTQKSTTRLFTLADLELKDQMVITEIIKKHLEELNLVQSPYCLDIKLLVDTETMEILE